MSKRARQFNTAALVLVALAIATWVIVRLDPVLDWLRFLQAAFVAAAGVSLLTSRLLERAGR